MLASLQMPLQLHRPPANPPSRSYSQSSDSYESTAPPADRSSLFSFFSSSDHTAVSDSPAHYKGLPTLPKSSVEGYRRSDEYEQYPTKHAAEPSEEESLPAVYSHPLTTSVQLAAALGPDNLPCTTEIDSIPCAGVRIPHGPLTGLLAWRMVVRIVPQNKGKRTWWGKAPKNQQRSNSYHADTDTDLDALSPPRPSMAHSFSYSATLPHNSMPALEDEHKSWMTVSTASLPLARAANRHTFYSDTHLQEDTTPPSRPNSAVLLSRHAHVDSHNHNDSAPAAAVATNFVLDTSLPYSLIARDTLCALGFPLERLPSAQHDPHAMGPGEDIARPRDAENWVVELSVQGVRTRARVARPGEASRLGVQFLKDAGVSLSFPGDGVGPILYVESNRLWRDVPKTITSLPHHSRGSKMTLPQRVKALFGLS